MNIRYEKLIVGLMFTFFGLFAKAEAIDQRLVKGLEILYRNQQPTEGCEKSESCPETIDRQKLAFEAEQMKKKFNALLENYKFAPFKRERIDSLSEKITFASAIQSDNDPANSVVGYLYLPRMASVCIGQGPIPATVLVHHVADNLDDEKMFAKWAAQSGQGAILLIYLPGYGPRKKAGSEHPFPDTIQEFKQRLLQSLLDIRVAGEYLKRETNSSQEQMQLGGISLGGIMTALSAGFDPYFSKYWVGLGGGDIARVLTLDKSVKTTGVIKNALENIKWHRDDARKELSVIDPITWAPFAQTTKITIMNAVQDELIDQEHGFQKYVDALAVAGIKPKVLKHSGTHVPNHKELGIMKTLGIYMRLMNQINGFLGTNESGSCVN